MKDFVRIMAQALVNNPSLVEVEEKPGLRTTVYELRVAKDDLGRIIGKDGRTAQSMRTLLNAAFTRMDKRAVLDIVG